MNSSAVGAPIGVMALVSPSCVFKACAHRVDDSPRGRNDSQRSQRSGIDHDLVIDHNLEFAIAPVDHSHVATEFAAQAPRHPGGVQAR